MRILLAINVAFFIIEAAVGWIGQSTGLLADSLDMLADASVYGTSLFAVGRSAKLQRASAYVSGITQLLLGLGVLCEVLRRFVYGSEPMSALMMIMGAAALIANTSCLALLAKHRQGGIHMRASWIFSANDVLANVGVMISGLAVFVFRSPFPDLLIGSAISVLVIRGGKRILQECRSQSA